jgi:hypothetical protein
MTLNPWSSIQVPDQVLSIPGMLSDEEKRYLIWLTSCAYQGWGAIVDLGCWLGCSSAALAEGLKRSKRLNCVESRDLFAWEPSYMEQCYPANLAQDADFQPLFESFTAPFRNWISVERADLMTHRWLRGPIEILFIDAAKSWDLTNKIFETFGPHIIPNKTRVILQDFRHYSTTWLPLIMDSRGDLWREVEAVEEGWTVTFIALKEVLGVDGIKLPLTAGDFSFELAENLFARRIDASNGEARRSYQLGLRELAVTAGRLDIADSVQFGP